MVNENNRNAFIGRNVEVLYKNSVGDYPSVIKAIQDKYKIEGRYITSITSGIHGEKADVKMSFACGHNIDVNIKAYKLEAGFNQLTRTTVSRFSEIFNFSPQEKEDLTSILIEKSRNTDNYLFPANVQERWRKIFISIAPDILKWSFSHKQGREILVLYERNNSVMKIYPMKDSLSKLSSLLTFTKGGFNIGDCVSFQRKGGNGKASKTIPKDDIKHPGNNIQIKLKVNKFVELMEDVKICQYNI